MLAEIQVISPGTWSCIQDRGRPGYRKYGVPLSGAMDQESAHLANAFLGNDPKAAVLEITLTGPKLVFPVSTHIALAGADMSPTLNGEPVPLNRLLTLQPADELAFGKLNYGTRCYLAVQHGFQTEKVLGSRSWFKGITPHFRLGRGMTLPVRVPEQALTPTFTSAKVDPAFFTTPEIPVHKGPEFDRLSPEAKHLLLTERFTISRSNDRMGYKLEGTPIESGISGGMITRPVQPGTVQLLPSGQLIILMRDCQTTGGYPRVLQLGEEGICRVGQRRGGEIGFLDIVPSR